MTYGNNHSENECDKCGEFIGKNKLIKIPFIYLDRNDKSHEDISEQYGYPKGFGYRQYWVCQNCLDKGI